MSEAERSAGCTKLAVYLAGRMVGQSIGNVLSFAQSQIVRTISVMNTHQITNRVLFRPNRPTENVWADTTAVVEAGQNRNSAAKERAAKGGEATRSLCWPSWAGETSLLFLKR